MCLLMRHSDGNTVSINFFLSSWLSKSVSTKSAVLLVGTGAGWWLVAGTMDC